MEDSTHIEHETRMKLAAYHLQCALSLLDLCNEQMAAIHVQHAIETLEFPRAHGVTMNQGDT